MTPPSRDWFSASKVGVPRLVERAGAQVSGQMLRNPILPPLDLLRHTHGSALLDRLPIKQALLVAAVAIGFREIDTLCLLASRSGVAAYLQDDHDDMRVLFSSSSSRLRRLSLSSCRRSRLRQLHHAIIAADVSGLGHSRRSREL